MKIAIKREQNPNLFEILSSVNKLREAKKNNHSWISVISMIWKSKLLKTMRLTLLAIVVSVVQIFAANTYSQETRLSLNLKNTSIRNVLEQIENRTDFYFIYNAKAVDVDKKVDVEFENKSVAEILDKLFEGTNVVYKIDRRQVAISANSVTTGIQQNRSVSGKVTDSSGTPLPGVTVSIKNTTQGTITDAQGNYSLTNVPSDAILIFSFVGMRTQEIAIAGKNQLETSMMEEAIGIDEVVAVGYGTMKKANLTGSVSTVSSNTLVDRPSTNPTNLLQGRISGLQVTQPSGQPGKDDAIFRIRGLGSFGASSSPLVIIDGVIGSLSNLAPNDIENITVLKDAASASIYGARAANGVILVSTKQAKQGASIEYQIDYGVHTATRLPDLITNSAEYMEMYNAARIRSGLASIYTQEQIDAYKHATDKEEYPNFDWLDYYFNSARVINHYLSLENVTDKSSYKFSLNYLDQEGILPNINYKKYNAQLNFSNQLTKFIKVGTNVSAVFKDNHEPPNWEVTSPLIVYQNGPLYKPFLPDGSGRKTAWAYPAEGHNVTAPVVFDNGARYTKNYVLNAQAYIDITLLKGLVWSVKGAVNYSDNTIKDHVYATHEHYFYHKLSGEEDYTLASTVTSPGSAGVTDNYNKSILPSIYSVLNYESRIGKDHYLRGMIGYEQQSFKYQYLSGNRKIFPTSSLMELNAGSSTGQTVGGSAYEWALKSYFGRIGYDFKGKYLIEANARYDGTSRVAEAHRWGFFPSISAGWRISEEKFIMNKFSWMNSLKLRASYGVLGNQEIGNYPYQDILSLTGYPLDGSLAQGVLITRLTDKNLKWESTKVFDIGLDMDLYNGLFGLTLDWFKKKTFDILATQPVPGSLGLSGPTTNNGELQNTGWEIEVKHGRKIGEFQYDVNFILSTFKNELLSIITPTKGVNEVGLPYDSFYLYEMEGIFQSPEDIENSPQHIFYTPRPGDIKIKNQNDDNVINADDRISISPYPDFTYSFGLNFSWRRFGLSAFFQGVEGLKTQIYGWGYDPFVQGDPPSVRFRNAWTSTNPSNTEPAVYIGSGSATGGYSGVYGYPSTYHLPDASYLRLKNVNLSYTLPKKVFDRLKLQDLTIYLSGDNLFTFTKFPGIDPELPSSSTRGSAYPQVRILNAGVKVKF
ncbi:MAG: TonB-dependent receptor [Mangrovibacterium sp.]